MRPKGDHNALDLTDQKVNKNTTSYYFILFWFFVILKSVFKLMYDLTDTAVSTIILSWVKKVVIIAKMTSNSINLGKILVSLLYCLLVIV